MKNLTRRRAPPPPLKFIKLCDLCEEIQSGNTLLKEKKKRLEDDRQRRHLLFLHQKIRVEGL